MIPVISDDQVGLDNPPTETLSPDDAKPLGDTGNVTVIVCPACGCDKCSSQQIDGVMSAICPQCAAEHCPNAASDQVEVAVEASVNRILGNVFEARCKRTFK